MSLAKAVKLRKTGTTTAGTPAPAACSSRSGDVTVRARCFAGGTAQLRMEKPMELLELKEKSTLAREAAAARLHAIADELASGNDVVIERGDLRFVAHVPDQVNLKVEFEVEDDGTELEIELTW